MGPRNYTKLHFAAQSGNLDEVKRLLRNGKNPNHFDDIGCTPLHHAAAEGHVEIVKALLAAGADVNAHDDGVIGNTAINHIAGNCSLEMATLLIDAGANPNICGWMWLNALDGAKTRKRGDGPAVYALLCEASGRFPKGRKRRLQLSLAGRPGLVLATRAAAPSRSRPQSSARPRPGLRSQPPRATALAPRPFSPARRAG